MAQQYQPSPEARKEAIRAAAVGIIMDKKPAEIVAEMSWRCIKTDFNGSVSTEQNEAVMAFNVVFMVSVAQGMDDHANGRFKTTPRDD